MSYVKWRLKWRFHLHPVSWHGAGSFYPSPIEREVKRKGGVRVKIDMERETGLEPATACLEGRNSTNWVTPALCSFNFTVNQGGCQRLLVWLPYLVIHMLPTHPCPSQTHYWLSQRSFVWEGVLVRGASAPLCRDFPCTFQNEMNNTARILSEENRIPAFM